MRGLKIADGDVETALSRAFELPDQLEWRQGTKPWTRTG